jgi:hypothetical protein
VRRGRGGVVAVLWLAPGVLYRDDLMVATPPQDIVLPIYEPLWMHAAAAVDEAVPTGPQEHRALFRPQDAWHPSHERVHYLLASSPRPGYRWLAHEGSLMVEPV